MTPIPAPDADAASPPPDPHVTAFVACDHVHQDRSTAKFTILGTTTRFEVRHIAPSICTEIGLYARVTNMRGRYSFAVQLFSAEDERPVGHPAFLDSITTADPLKDLEMHMNQTDTRLPAPGRYVIRLYANARFLQALVVSFEATGGT